MTLRADTLQQIRLTSFLRHAIVLTNWSEWEWIGRFARRRIV